MDHVPEISFFSICASFTGDIQSAMIDGHMLYFEANSELLCVDITEPTQPRTIATLALAQPIHTMDLAHGVIYAMGEIDDDSSTITQIDIANSAAPAIIATDVLPINPIKIRVIAGDIWLADTWQGLYRLTITPGGKIDLALAHKIEDGCWGIAPQFPLLALAARASGLQIVDITDPQRVVLRGSCSLAGHCDSITLDRTVAYLTAGKHGVHIVDIADPTRPRRIATYTDPQINTGHVEIIGQRAVLAGDPARVVDISDPAQPKLVGLHQWGIFHTTLGERIGLRIRPHGVDLIRLDQDAL